MIRKLTALAAGWKIGTANDYHYCYNQYGGNFITHPDVLLFLEERLKSPLTYYIKTNKNNELIGSYCTWNQNQFAVTGKLAKQLGIDLYPFNKDEIILPLHTDLKTIIPCKTKMLSAINNNNIINATFKLNSQRTICLAKSCGEGGFSSTTKSSRRRELKRFINAGGEFIDQSAFSPEQLTAIFIELFEKRWGYPPANRAEMIDMLTSLRSMFFGYVLFFEGKACAFQLITKAESPNWICFDYINGGYDQTHDAFCPGTIVTWLNVSAADELCSSVGKTMRYSFGRPSAEYKDRWCYRAPLGRMLAF